MTRRAVVALLHPIRWQPPGVAPARWRRALVEDTVDLLTSLNEVTPAIAYGGADRELADAVVWPGMARYELAEPSVAGALAAASEDGFQQAAVLVTDAPDLPGLLIGKLLRPLSTRTVAVAPALDGAGLLGVAARLPAAAWFPPVDLERGSVGEVRAAAPRPTDVAGTPGWRRLRDPGALGTLDPAVEGWEATRLLLSRP